MYLQQRQLLEVAEALAPNPHGDPSPAAVLRVGAGGSKEIRTTNCNLRYKLEKVNICLAETRAFIGHQEEASETRRSLPSRSRHALHYGCCTQVQRVETRRSSELLLSWKDAPEYGTYG